MTKDQAYAEMINQSAWLPFRIWGIAGKDGEWIVYNGLTKARGNNLVRKGYSVFQLNKG